MPLNASAGSWGTPRQSQYHRKRSEKSQHQRWRFGDRQELIRLQCSIANSHVVHQTSKPFVDSAVVSQQRADAEFVYQRLASHGAKLIKMRKFKESVGFLSPLKDFPAVKPENKFQLALAQLKLHAHTVSTNRQHPGVELLSDLYRGSAYPVFETLKKEKGLAPEDLFALGFNLVERGGQERGLGIDLLEHVAAKFPRNKIGRSAKNKLKLITV